MQRVNIPNNRSLSIQQKAELIPSLQYNGKEIVMTNVNGIWWFAIKPLCEMLKVNYDYQFKKLKEDEFLNQLYVVQHIVAADNKQRDMLCLPEEYIHLWLLELVGEDKDLRKNKFRLHLTIKHFFNAPDAERQLNLKKIAELKLRNEQLDKIIIARPDTPEEKEKKDNIKLIKEYQKDNNIIDNDKVEEVKQTLLFDMQNNPIEINQLPCDDMVAEEE